MRFSVSSMEDGYLLKRELTMKNFLFLRKLSRFMSSKQRAVNGKKIFFAGKEVYPVEEIYYHPGDDPLIRQKEEEAIKSFNETPWPDYVTKRFIKNQD
jgi:hypothetical protein